MKANKYYSEKYGREFTLKELSNMSKFPTTKIRSRIKSGYSADEAAEFTPSKCNFKPYYSEKYGKNFTMKELCELSGKSETSIRYRLNAGYSVDEAADFTKCIIHDKPGIHYSEKYGKKFNVNELSKISGIPANRIKARIRYGYSVDEAAEFVTFIDSRGNLHYSEKYGKKFTVNELSKISGIPSHKIRNRIKSGYSADQAAEFVLFTGHSKPYYSEKYKKYFTVKELSDISMICETTIRARLKVCSTDEAAGFVPYLSQYKNKQRVHKRVSIKNILVIHHAYSNSSTDYYECIDTETNETFIKSKEELYKLYEEERKK